MVTAFPLFVKPAVDVYMRVQHSKVMEYPLFTIAYMQAFPALRMAAQISSPPSFQNYDLYPQLLYAAAGKS